MALPQVDPLVLLAQDARLRGLARALARDGARADDLAQESWLAALREPAPIESLARFLERVARRLAGRERRGAARRVERESAAARPEVTASAADILEREDTRRRVIAALLALDEPFRTTLVLRHLEDLPPRAIARRMGVPVETVRSRTRRGLAELRARLDGEFGTRERWLAGLVVLARPTPSSGLLLTLLSMKTKLAAVALLLFACAWFLLPDARTSATRGAGPAARAPDAAAPAELADAGVLAPPASAPPGERTLVAAAGAPPVVPPPSRTATGALRAHVVAYVVVPNHHDTVGRTEAIPEARVRVTSDALENPDLCAFEAGTGADGYALLTGLPPGRAEVTVDRSFAPPESVEIVAGATVDVELVLERGFAIDGVVTDEEERPVGGAEIWFGKFADLANGACIARSAADGTFRLLAISHAHLGARAAGYRPSKIAYFYASEGAEVTAHLVVRAGGGAVHGRVVGSTGESVPGALVRVGAEGPEQRSRSEEIDADWGALALTDEQGRFELAGLAPGPSPVLVRRAGFALFRDVVDVPAGGSASFTAVLADEAALAGHVREASGSPARGVLVRVGADGGPFRASARTDEDGAFRVGALESGVPLEAWVEGAPGTARTTFTAEVGRTETWEAVLETLGEVRGRVVDERGAPLAWWVVRLDDLGPEAEPDEGYAQTAADGSFAFEHVHARAHLLTVSAMNADFAPSLVRADVRPAEDELVLTVRDSTVPSARVTGRFLDEEGRVLPTAQIVPWIASSVGAPIETCDPATGRFQLGPFPPGGLRLILSAPGRGALVREHVLAPGEKWDVGEVRLVPEGRLRVRLAPAGFEPGADVELTLGPGHFESFEGDGLERRSPPLAPGAYALRVRGGALEEQALPFEIESGAETVLDVPLRRGWRVPVVVRAPESVPFAWLRVSLPGGAPLVRFLGARDGESFVETLHLAAGTYAVAVEAGERRVTGTLAVAPVDRTEPALELQLE